MPKGRHTQPRVNPLAMPTVVVALLTLVVVGGLLIPRALTPDPVAESVPGVAAPATTSAAAATSSPVAAPHILVHMTADIFHAGTAVAGDSITPGLWASDGGPRCRWSRNLGASWETAGNPRQRITIHLANGATFMTFDCAVWLLYRAD